jgi:hypothetical protein
MLPRAVPAVFAPLHARLVQSVAKEFTAYDVGSSTNIKWHEGGVPTEDKEKNLNQRGCVLWFTGLSGSGKSTVACTLEHALKDMGKGEATQDCIGRARDGCAHSSPGGGWGRN